MMLLGKKYKFPYRIQDSAFKREGVADVKEKMVIVPLQRSIEGFAAENLLAGERDVPGGR